MFNTDHNPPIGTPEQLTEGLRVVTAPNASPMTFTGTRSYLLGEAEVAVIDPGPDDPAHFEALMNALAGQRVSHIIVTHSHVDHSPLARRLAKATDAPVYGYGPSGAGMSDVMQGLSGLAGGEGVDRNFRPDFLLKEGDKLMGNGWHLEAVHTPGHMSNHLCFASEDALFSGDHVMGWSTTLVSPPDGDLTQFMASMHKLEARGEGRYYPGHGAVLENAPEMVAHQISHRLAREAQILEALPGTVPEITARVYRGLDNRLLPMAARNVFSHLIDLAQRGKVRTNGLISIEGLFEGVE